MPYKMVKQTPSDPAALNALMKIDEIIAGLPTESRGHVVDVLSALRGPDNGDEFVKDATTIHVRLEALPLTCKVDGGAGRWQTRTSEKTPVPREGLGNPVTQHFTDHVYRALAVLGWVREFFHDDGSREPKASAF